MGDLNLGKVVSYDDVVLGPGASMRVLTYAAGKRVVFHFYGENDQFVFASLPYALDEEWHAKLAALCAVP